MYCLLIALISINIGTTAWAGKLGKESCISDDKNFWTTAPGIVTAVAALIGALVTLLTFLQNTGLPVGTYKKTCSGFKVQGDVLEAECKSISGEKKFTSLQDFKKCKYGIKNEDGDLKCELE